MRQYFIFLFVQRGLQSWLVVVSHDLVRDRGINGELNSSAQDELERSTRVDKVQRLEEISNSPRSNHFVAQTSSRTLLVVLVQLRSSKARFDTQSKEAEDFNEPGRIDKHHRGDQNSQDKTTKEDDCNSERRRGQRIRNRT
jgi:hypothetical protein